MAQAVQLHQGTELWWSTFNNFVYLIYVFLCFVFYFVAAIVNIRKEKKNQLLISDYRALFDNLL